MKFEPTPGPHALDYVVLGVFLTICMGIGIFYGYRSDKQTTLEAYLFGDRKLLLVPVSLSLFVTFTSAISLMGIPAEIYVFGSMYTYTIIGSMLSILVGAVTIVPLLFPLKLTSAYEVWIFITYKSVFSFVSFHHCTVERYLLIKQKCYLLYAKISKTVPLVSSMEFC